MLLYIKRLIFLLVCIIISGISCRLAYLPSGYQASEQIDKNIRKIILHDTEIDYRNVPGFIIGVVDGDSTYIFTYGSKGTESTALLVGSDLFEIGSISKLFTSTLVDELAKKQLVDTNIPIGSMINSLSIDNPVILQMSLNNLITHQSGIPLYPSTIEVNRVIRENPGAGYSKDELIAYLNSFSPEPDQRFVFRYSHINYVLISLILEDIFKTPYEELLTRYVLTPLGMTTTRISLPDDVHCTQGHNKAGTPVNGEEFGFFSPAEGIKSSLNDLVKFTRYSLGMGPIYPSADHFTQQCNVPWAKDIGMGKGWYIIDQDKFDIFMHTGRTNGYRAYVNMIRETNTAVIILSNSSRGVENLDYLILRMINNNWKRKE